MIQRSAEDDKRITLSRVYRIKIFERAFYALESDQRRNLKGHRKEKTPILAGDPGAGAYVDEGVL